MLLQRTLASLLFSLLLLRFLPFSLLLLLLLLSEATPTLLLLLLLTSCFLGSTFSSKLGLALFTSLALPLFPLLALSLGLLLTFALLAFAFSFAFPLVRQTLPAFLLLARLLLFLRLALGFTLRAFLVAPPPLLLLDCGLLGSLSSLLGRLLSGFGGPLFLLRQLLLSTETLRHVTRPAYNEDLPLLVLFLLVLRLLLGLPFLALLVLILKLAEKLELTLLCDLLAVRLEHALLEHARRKD